MYVMQTPSPKQTKETNMSESSYDSYPPFLRPATINPPPSHQQQSSPPDSDPLPMVDFQAINHEKLGDACRDWGMFRLVNHGIPAALLNELDDHAKKIFSLSFESKQAMFERAPMAYFWGTPGLTPTGVAVQSLPVRNINWVEGFHVLLSGLSDAGYEDGMVETFRTIVEEYGNHQVRIATRIFEALALNLNLDPTKTKAYLSADSGNIRVYRYPRCSDNVADDQQPLGIDAHTDSTVLTTLHQDVVGGLQILSKDNRWLDVQPIPNSLIVNLGDMMQAISDDNYIAAKHRVKVHKQKDRISIGYFVFPFDDFVIQSSKYKPFTYPDFRAQVQHDLKIIGHKIGLPKFRVVEDFHWTQDWSSQVLGR